MLSGLVSAIGVFSVVHRFIGKVCERISCGEPAILLVFVCGRNLFITMMMIVIGYCDRQEDGIIFNVYSGENVVTMCEFDRLSKFIWNLFRGVNNQRLTAVPTYSANMLDCMFYYTCEDTLNLVCVLE